MITTSKTTDPAQSKHWGKLSSELTNTWTEYNLLSTKFRSSSSFCCDEYVALRTSNLYFRTLTHSFC
ncbi:hypothetical protein VTN77DRAFT_4997 [Rasamsonia byssochlamydoides]|uniref:uncharacterized protein n=1 Tax=Rasamsonia byssochlamydoides TaxID=89139 RepID=UPI00374436F4